MLNKNSEKFKSIYNKMYDQMYRLNKLRGKYNGKYEGFTDLIFSLSENNSIIQKYQEDLKQYAKLRNAIVHTATEEVIAEPSDKTVERFQKIYQMFTEPPTTLKISSSPVTICKSGDLIVDVIKEMKKNIYTHIPVYQDKKFIGVFSEASAIRWLDSSAEKDGFILEETKIGDLIEYFDQSDDSYNGYKFISRNTNVFDIRESFSNSIKKQRRLGVIFVTADGKKNEKLLGIITAWDLPKIDKLLP
ncbi:MAG: CBS domain-containing protein [Candidatus Falkowbacteria bacterium]